jgi:hypothetical protein
MAAHQLPHMSGQHSLSSISSPILQLTHFRRPQTYERPAEPLDVTVTDISGKESEYNLDNHGFQIYKHTSNEKDFLDEEKIKAEYYAETEQLLKDA